MTKKKLTFEDLPAAMTRLLEDVAKIKKMLKAQEAAAKKEKTAETKTEPKAEVAPNAMEIGIEKASELLKRSKQTIYALVKSGALVARKQGARLIFTMEQLAEYANRHKKSTPKRTQAKPVSRSRKQPARRQDRHVQPPVPAPDSAPQSAPIEETA